MAVRITCMPLSGVGDDTFSIHPSMFMVDLGTGDGPQIPDAVRIKSDGYFYNCTYQSSTVLHLTNPASDDADGFQFEIEYQIGESGWVYTPGWYMGSSVSGTILYHSMGHYNIAMSGICNTLEEDTYSLAELCTSPNVNIYSPHRPDGSSPYRMGDFRLYTHTMPGGVGFGHAVYVETSYGSGVYTLTISPIPWLFHYKILGWIGTRWEAISGEPYDFVKLEVASAMSDYSALAPAFGGNGMIAWSGILTNNDIGGDSDVPYDINSYHCDTYDGSYVLGETDTVHVIHAAKPYSLGTLIYTGQGSDTARVDGTISGYTNISSIRFQAKDHGGVVRTGYWTVTADEAFYIENTSPSYVFDANYPYKLDVQYQGTTYVTESTRGNQSGFA